MNIKESLAWRYATKKFDPKKTLSEEKINTLIETFNLTATSYGLQPLKLIVVNNKEIQKELTKHSWNQSQVSDASHVFVICIETVIDEAYINTYFENVKAIRHTEDNILKPFRDHLIQSFSEKSQEEIAVWATKQAYIALGNLLTVCAIEQVDSCPMEGFMPEKYDELLSLKDQQLSSVLVLPVGYRAKDDMFSEMKKVRRSVEETIIKVQ